MSEMNSDNLADQLDRALPPHDPSVYFDDADDALVRVAVRLAHASKPKLSDTAMARIQAHVLEANHPKQVVRFPVQRVLRWAAAIILVAVFISAGAVPASANSVPGEVLYPVKRGAERVELVLTASDFARARTHLIQAGRRLQEAGILLEAQRFEESLIDDSLDSVAQAARIVPADITDENLNALRLRAAQIAQDMQSILDRAIQVSATTPEQVQTYLKDAQTIGGNLLPPAPSPTAIFTETTTSTATLTATDTPTATPTATDAPTTTDAPTDTLTATNTPTTTDEPTGVPAYVYATNSVNLREGPGTAFPIIAQLNPNAEVIVIGEDETGDWTRVSVEDNTVGWIATFLVSPQPIVLPAPTVTTPPDNPIVPGDDPVVPDDPPPSGDECDLPGNACNAPGQTGDNPGLGDQPPPGQDKDR